MRKSAPFYQAALVSLLIQVYSVSLRAYIEPGFTSYFLKILISVLVGGALAFRYLWSRIKPYFRRLKEGKRAEAEGSEDKEP